MDELTLESLSVVCSQCDGSGCPLCDPFDEDGFVPPEVARLYTEYDEEIDEYDEQIDDE